MIVLAVALMAGLVAAAVRFAVDRAADGHLVVAAIIPMVIGGLLLRSRRMVVSDELCVVELGGIRVSYRWADLVGRRAGTLYFATGLVVHNDDLLSRYGAKRVRWRVPAFLFVRDWRALPIGVAR